MTKKRFFLGMLFSAILLLTACGGKEANNANGAQGADGANANGTLKIAIEGAYPPYNYMNKDNQLEGFDVDISNELAKRLGVKPELIAIPWDSMIPGLLAKKYDIIVSDMAITEERKKKVDFSDPYFHTGQMLFVPANSTIKDPSEIKGKKIGVTISTTAAEIATQLGADVVLFKSDFLAFSDMANGRLEGFITDQGVGARIMMDNKYDGKSVGNLLNTEAAGITIRKEDTALKEKINKALADMKNDGTFEAISKKWFGRDIR
ncbi:transporter substrate-binding domain-containing protein [Brevibacillus sp. H7]|uniref:transporter substrate-binding domain-containing protein n=1 Tax=Brevibacillus sp. H7 TaxID=3349138 RepID=UPI0038214BDD